jgi:hypothetical protein
LFTLKPEVKVHGHHPSFMIAPQQQHIIRVLNFEHHQERNDLNTKQSPVNIITQEQVPVVLGKSVLFKNIQQIKKLSMNVAYNHHRRAHA